MDDNDLLDFVHLSPIAVPDKVQEVPSRAPRWSAPVQPAAPAYGLVGVQASAVTTRDVKVFAIGAGIGGLLAVVFSWLGRAGRSA